MGKTHQTPYKAPIARGGKGIIDTKWQDINWTPAKLGIAFAGLGIPFLIVMIWIFQSGNALVGIIFVGLAMFVGLMYLALRFIDKTEF